MNGEFHELEGVDVERHQVKEALKVLMHSIVFQRALGEYRFLDAESELFDLSYVRCDSRVVERAVEEHAESCSRFFDRPDLADPQQICCVSFFERRSRPGGFGFFRSEEKVTWERWHVPVRVIPPLEAGSGALDRRRRQQDLETRLRSQLALILSLASTRKEHIPPADGLGGEVPWFEFSSSGSDGAWKGMDLFKQLLTSTPLLNASSGGGS